MRPISHPNLQRLLDYWEAKRGDREMPARADLDPLDITYVMGNIILVDVLAGMPLRFHIRLHGTTLVQRVGYELTGKMLDELPQTEFRELARHTFTHVINTRRPFNNRRDRQLDDRQHIYETVIMPLSSNGQTIDMLMVGLIYDDEKW